MNGGDSDVTAPIYRWNEQRFEEHEALPLSGGEDIEFFSIDGNAYLATASVRTGRGPYQYNVAQTIYRRTGKVWVPFQSIPGFAAKQWRFFTVEDRRFLALAQGVTLPQIEASNPRTSRLFEWDGAQFTPFVALEGRWGYGWEPFVLEGRHFLAYADHVGQSSLLEWDGSSYARAQDFGEKGGRCFRFIEAGPERLLAYANILGDSVLYRWDGAKFAVHQILSGPGGREFCLLDAGEQRHLVQVNFIQGDPSAPRTCLESRVYAWNGLKMELADKLPTSGGTEATAFSLDGAMWVAVSNSLTADVRFRTDTVIYRASL